MLVQHFLTLDDLPPEQLQQLIDRALHLKQSTCAGAIYEPLKNKTLAMIFSKSSTRTRVSFEVAMRQLGGGAIILNPGDTQMRRGEPIEDSARVISSMVDSVVIRTDAHQQLQRFAEYSSVPVINGLTDDYHPCQLLADLLTLRELRGDFSGCTAAWVGDGNNVCHSWMNAARIFNFKLNIATPAGYAPNASVIKSNKQAIKFFDDAQSAVDNADVVITDTWASMGQEDQKDRRLSQFESYRVDQSLMAMASDDALFMHCLPAYRGMEVSDSVIDGKQSVVFLEAENRLHAQKALLELLLS
ncbi:MAG: ornithine carbamoyltransferase [Arenicella sp.]|nr:ornithine carbamoyltransferase [Arenicella sp.]